MLETKIKEYIRKLVQEMDEELDEITTTANIDGFNTPYAFLNKKSKKDKEKRKRTATQMGYTIVGEGRRQLSGGQKQRINLARAFYRDPDILILDEATSGLDSLTESKIADYIRTSASKRITFAVAHRLTFVSDYDLILVFNEGSIVEYGTHSELILKDGYYKRLWEAQNGL